MAYPSSSPPRKKGCSGFEADDAPTVCQIGDCSTKSDKSPLAATRRFSSSLRRRSIAGCQVRTLWETAMCRLLQRSLRAVSGSIRKTLAERRQGQADPHWSDSCTHCFHSRFRSDRPSQEDATGMPLEKSPSLHLSLPNSPIRSRDSCPCACLFSMRLQRCRTVPRESSSFRPDKIVNCLSSESFSHCVLIRFPYL